MTSCRLDFATQDIRCFGLTSAYAYRSPDPLRHPSNPLIDTSSWVAAICLRSGWPLCAKFSGLPGSSSCVQPAPRAANGSIVADPAKFPDGMAAVAEYLHARGLRLGIYTAPHAQTCGGYTGSLGYEAVDAATFAAWGIDAWKLDAGCRNDCSLLDGCLQASLARVRDGLNATGRRVVFYIDEGNPTAGPMVYNPKARGWPQNAQTATHFARNWTEYVLQWGPATANAFKIWFDRNDHWHSLMANTQQQVGLQWFQKPGAWIHPDQMTVGQGHLSAAESRTEVFLYAVLAAPMFLSAAPAGLSPELLALVTNPEVLAVNWDPDGTMATLVATSAVTDRVAVDCWVKPMSDGSFVFVVVNRDSDNARLATIAFGDGPGGDGSLTDIFPAGTGEHATVRDLGARKDLGTFLRTWSVTLQPHDSAMVRVTPTD